MGDFSILGIRIRELRTSMKMNQRDFSKFVGCTAATLSAYENGSKSPSLEIVKNIAEKCNVSIDWLCGLTDKGSSDNTLETYADLIKILLKIQDIDLIPSGISLFTDEKYDSAGKFQGRFSGIVTETNEMYHIIQDIQKMQAILDDGTLDKDIFDTWLNGFLEKHNKPLLTYQYVSSLNNQEQDIEENE